MLKYGINDSFAQQPLRINTPGYEAFSVKFDVFTGEKLACASASEFGLRGPGRLWIFNTQGALLKTLQNQEGFFDLAWSESNPNILAAGAADGMLLMVDASSPQLLRSQVKAHSREVSSISWNMLDVGPQLSRQFTIDAEHLPKGPVYEACWSPKDASMFLSAGFDRSIYLWDYRASIKSPSLSLKNCHENEILSLDWNKWDTSLIATGSVDNSVKIWDLRAVSKIRDVPQHVLRGHRRAVRKIRWSPYSPSNIFTVGYDMSLKSWDIRSLNPLVGFWEGHTEFISGLDISLHEPSLLLATASWDQSIALIRPSNLLQNYGA